MNDARGGCLHSMDRRFLANNPSPLPSNSNSPFLYKDPGADHLKHRFFVSNPTIAFHSPTITLPTQNQTLATYNLHTSTTMQLFLFIYAIFALLFSSALAGPLAMIENGLTPPKKLCSKETSKFPP